MESFANSFDTFAGYAMWAILAYHIIDYLWDVYQEKKNKTKTHEQ